jgi:hypothetical protein
METEKIELIKISNVNDARKHGLGCITNPKHPGFDSKLKWLKSEFENGLRMVILKVDGKSAGMIEFTPSEFFWRPVNAMKYLIIHCLWILNTKFHKKGYGSLLIQEVIKDARQQKLNGVGVVTSDGPWMSGKKVFIKNNFKQIALKGRFELLVKELRKGKLPEFINWEENLHPSMHFEINYANQCPMFAKCITDMSAIAVKNKIPLKVKEIRSATLSRNSPSGYGVMNITKNGKVFADHYISGTRFLNIIKKEKI